MDALGLRRGDTIAVLLENQERFHEVCWAARRSGLYFTPVNHHLGGAEAAYIINDSSAKVLVSSRAFARLDAELGPDALPTVTHRFMIGGTVPGWESYEAAVADQRDPTPALAYTEGEILQYSSGTTGRPKGIKRPLPREPLPLEAVGVIPFLRKIGFGEGDVYLSPAPLYHSAPLSWTMGVHRLGGTVVVMERFDPEQYLALVERYQVSHSMLVPTHFVRMLKLAAEVRTRYDLSSLRQVIHVAAPCPVPVKHQMIEWWGPIISEFYSSSEGAGGTFITADEWLAHPGSVGRPFFGTPHILDDDGRELPPGTPGELWFESPVPFEYLNDPAKTRASRNPRGWVTVGDVGYLDPDGFLYLTDRKNFTIISGGVNIYPREVEDVLVCHPQVTDVAVFAVPDSDLGEAVKAVVQPVTMADATPELATELIEFCRSRLASYKCPRTVDFERELPRAETGKLYKRLLQDRYRTRV